MFPAYLALYMTVRFVGDPSAVVQTGGMTDDPSADAIPTEGSLDLPQDKPTQAGEREVISLVEQPAKVMRIGTMIKQLLEEVRAAPLDEAGRSRLREIHETSIRELEDGLAPELRAELDRLTLPFGDGIPSEAELRIAQAQLVGWLEGLFHGIQAAFAQQMAFMAHQQEARQRGLPGAPGGLGGPGGLDGPGDRVIVEPGQYL